MRARWGVSFPFSPRYARVAIPPTKCHSHIADQAKSGVSSEGSPSTEHWLLLIVGPHVSQGRACERECVWCGVVWCGVVLRGVVWCGVAWCGVVVVWRGVVWCCVVWCGVAWCGVVVVWCGVAWCGVAWRGVAWRGVAWRDVVWLVNAKANPTSTTFTQRCGEVWCGACACA